MSPLSSNSCDLLAGEVLHRIASDLSLIIDRDLALEPGEVARLQERPAGPGQVHISFRFGVQGGQRAAHGCLLVPLPDALSIAGYMMMLPEEQVLASRGGNAPDVPTREALMELSNFVAGAVDASLRELLDGGRKVRSEGCQGVRADVRPALVYEEGTCLVAGKARATIEGHPAFEVTLVLPALEEL